MARIGIKLADGSFYPVLEDETRQRKRMVLTVARDGQTSAQIDILRRDGASDQYVGCLVLEDLPRDGATELELVIGLAEDGTVDARVSDTAGEQYQSLSVNLSTLATDESYSLPDDEDVLGDIGAVDSLEEIGMPDLEDTADDDLSGIDLDQAFDDAPADSEGLMPEPEIAMPDVSLPDDDTTAPDETSFDESSLDEDDEMAMAEEPRRFSALTLAAILLLGLSAVALGAFAVFRWLQTDALPGLRAAWILPLFMRRRR